LEGELGSKHAVNAGIKEELASSDYNIVDGDNMSGNLTDRLSREIAKNELGVNDSERKIREEVTDPMP
jgi:hypothetical protein